MRKPTPEENRTALLEISRDTVNLCIGRMKALRAATELDDFAADHPWVLCELAADLANHMQMDLESVHKNMEELAKGDSDESYKNQLR